MKMSVRPKDKIQYFLKSPTQTRKTFSIVRRVTRFDSGDVEYGTVAAQQVELLNKLYLSKGRSMDSTRAELKLIVRDLYTKEFKRRGEFLACDENHKIYELYLEKKYPVGKRSQIDFKAAENETARTLRILGTSSIVSSSQEVIQACIDKIDPSQQKRYLSRLRSILSVIGRGELSLYCRKASPRRVSHLTRKDLDILVKAIIKETNPIAGISPTDFSVFVKCLFGTGMRIGEAIAIEETDLVRSKYFIKVNKQLKQDNSISKTKNGKSRKAVVFVDLIDDVEKWIQLDKRNFSRFQASKYLSHKTREVFPDSPVKHLSSHGLRHSYAIHLLRVLDVSLSNVASFLGDSIKTTEDYYIDYVVDDELISSVVRKMT